MKVASIIYTNYKHSIKSLLASQLFPKGAETFWVIDKPLFNVPERYNRTVRKGGFVEDLGLIFQRLVNPLNFDVIVKITEDAILYKPECLIDPIASGSSDIVYFRDDSKSVDFCYAIGKNCIQFLQNVNLENSSESEPFLDYFTKKNPWPLKSQISTTKIDGNTEDLSDVIVGNYPTIGNNDTFARVNTVLRAQGKTEICFGQLDSYIEEIMSPLKEPETQPQAPSDGAVPVE